MSIMHLIEQNYLSYIKKGHCTDIGEYCASLGYLRTLASLSASISQLGQYSPTSVQLPYIIIKMMIIKIEIIENRMLLLLFGCNILKFNVFFFPDETHNSF